MTEKKTFLSENRWPVVFTLLVIIAGTGAVYWQGYFDSDKFRKNSAVFSDAELKVVFEGSDPEFLAYIPVKRLSGFPTMVGEPVPDADSMVLGYEEAKEMTAENNVTMSEALWGYNINDFLGREIRVSGMLKKTNSVIDMMHILPKERFDESGAGERIEVKFTEEKMPKLFYSIRPDNSNWPKNAKFAEGSLKDFIVSREDNFIVARKIGRFDLVVSEDRAYLPLVLGSREAEMMIEEGIFANIGDRIEDFFGNRVIVVGVLEETDTVLDMFHYMPAA